MPASPAGPAGADGHPVAEGLGEGDDVGADARGVLEPEPAAGAAEAGLDLVEHEERFVLVAELADRGEVARWGRLDAAFTLDGFEEHGADALVERGGEDVGFAERDLAEPGGEGLEDLLLLGLAGRGEGGEGAAVERPVGGEDVVAVGAAVALPVAAGELDGALVGFGAGVGEEDAAVAAEEGVEALREAGLEVVEVQVGDVEEGAGLVRDGVGDGGVGVAEGDDGEAGEEVEVAAAGGVVELGAIARGRTRRGAARRCP